MHHLARVLRLKDTDEIEVFDGLGRHALARFSSKAGQSTLPLVSGSIVLGRIPLQIALLQALPKGRRMDLIVEKGTELGVTTIWPLLTERVVARPDRRQYADKVDRWQRVALNASRQCGTKWAPDICPISSLGDALGSMERVDLFLVGSLLPGARRLREVMRDASRSSTGRGSADQPYRVALLIGPEGDLTVSEVGAAVEAGAIPVTFGELVLRVETAALYGVSVLAYELACDR